MAPRIGNRGNWPGMRAILALAIVLGLFGATSRAQGQSSEQQSPPPATAQPAQDVPDAPSTVQPPEPKPEPRPAPESESAKPAKPQKDPFDQGQPNREQFQPADEKPAPPPMSGIETLPSSVGPRNQLNPADSLYKISVSANFVQIPVTVKDGDGRRVDGLLPKDFSVLENGKKQNLTYFTSDPFELSVAVLLDIGMADVALQKINQTYSALMGAFSPYDEVALYTYSSTVSQVSDFTGRTDKLTALLNQMKLVRGHANGPPVLNGPLASGPTVNGLPVGGPPVAPVNTPPRESHVLNDAILRAALDLSKRERTRRKVIFVISDGRELGSKASYSDVLKVLETRNIQVKGIVVDSGALPVFKQLEKIHLKGQGFGDILPKYSWATGGGEPISELSRNAIEEAYAKITSEARNQYTLGYPTKAGASSAYRTLEVVVYKKGVKVLAKDGYYPISASR